MKEKNLCPTCKIRPICEPFVTCQDCFAIEVWIMEAFTLIQRDNGTMAALAARPVIEKMARSGWKEEYHAEYLTNLERLEQQEATGHEQ